MGLENGSDSLFRGDQDEGTNLKSLTQRREPAIPVIYSQNSCATVLTFYLRELHGFPIDTTSAPRLERSGSANANVSRPSLAHAMIIRQQLNAAFVETLAVSPASIAAAAPVDRS